MAKKLRICETVLRDGHQSILATRMRYEQMEPVLGLLDDIGYEALECWGGATYDSCLRFLNEDPWERLRKLKANLKNTPLQMLLRGQNLLGYKHYSDDVVEAFCNAAVKNGIDRIRIFDALNDPRNMEAAIKYSKKAGAHVQSAMVYTISPVHTTESFLKVAETLVEMGTDSLCIKDMSGLLGPADAYDLVSTFKKRFGELPIDLHSHFTCGLASTTYWEAAKAGVDIIDTAISPFAHATSQPATETMIEMFKGTEWDLGLDLDKYIPLVDHFRKVKQQIAEEFNLKPASDTTMTAPTSNTTDCGVVLGFFSVSVAASVLSDTVYAICVAFVVNTYLSSFTSALISFVPSVNVGFPLNADVGIEYVKSCFTSSTGFP